MPQLSVGANEGVIVGTGVGRSEGRGVGPSEGIIVGTGVGNGVGIGVGAVEGVSVGTGVGRSVGTRVGGGDGTSVGTQVGVGRYVGTNVGAGVGFEQMSSSVSEQTGCSIAAMHSVAPQHDTFPVSQAEHDEALLRSAEYKLEQPEQYKYPMPA